MTDLTSLSLREAARGFARQKSTSAVAVLTLGLGIGLCTAMFCVLYGVLLRPLSYGGSGRLVMAWAGYEGGASERDTFDEQSLLVWHEAGRAFEGAAGFRYAQYTLLQRGEPTSLQGAIVSPNFFAVLGVKARIGTVFNLEQVRAEQGKVVLLSHRLWRERFGGDHAVIGQAVNLGDELYTVVGVMPEDFDVPSQETAVWAPLPTAPSATRGKSLMVIGRMAPSVNLTRAQADVDGLARLLATQSPDAYRGMRIHLVPFFDELIKESRPLVLVSSGAALLVLLICCANIANLLLVRAIVKRSEFATRFAIGAQRRHLLGVIFSESLLLAFCGGIVGAGLARGIIAALLRLTPIELPRAGAIGHGFQIPVVAVGLIVIATLLISLPAAWEVVRSRRAVGPVQETRSTSRRFTRQLIVTLQIAMALTLLAGAGLMARTMLALRDANPGWKTDHLLAAQVFLPKRTYREPHQVRQFFETFIERLHAAPGVVSVAASSALPANPLGADFDLSIQVPGRATDNDGRAAFRVVTPGYFATLAVPVLQGREFDERDGDPQVKRIIVNQSFARKYLADSPAAVGQQVSIFLGPPQPYEIVGVVGDVHHYGMLREAKPEFYLPFASRPFGGMGVAVRTTGDPRAFAAAFRKELWALDPALPIANMRSMDELVQDTWSDRTFLTILLAFFTVVVVALTVVGVFSVVTFSVKRQVREIGIRMALGARGEDVVRLVMGQSARTVVAGVALGLVGAWMLGRALASLMYGGSASDPWVLLAGAVGIVVVAAAGAYLPSRRAAKIDPAAALRVQ